MIQQAEGLLGVSSNRISNAANLCALLYQELSDVSWAGFYFLDDDNLMVGPLCTGLWWGVTRRSLENHQGLREALAVHYGDAFQNVILEGRSLKDQFELFRGARLVIGQHGAGLANCLWLEPGANGH